MERFDTANSSGKSIPKERHDGKALRVFAYLTLASLGFFSGSVLRKEQKLAQAVLFADAGVAARRAPDGTVLELRLLPPPAVKKAAQKPKKPATKPSKKASAKASKAPAAKASKNVAK